MHIIHPVRQNFLAVREEKKPLGLRSDHHLTLNVSAESRANAIMFGGFYVSSVHIFKPTDIF